MALYNTDPGEYENPVKHVLFIAPNLPYASTVVRNLSDKLKKKGISSTLSYPDRWETPFLDTEHVKVTFEYSDPVVWTANTFCGIDCVFGKKELVELFKKQYAARTRVPVYNGSLERFIIETEQDAGVYSSDLRNIPPKTSYLPEISKVHFNYPMTIVIWEDGTKTMVKCQDDDLYSEEVGLALCVAKKALGNKGNFNNVFRKWVPEEESSESSNGISYKAADILARCEERFRQAMKDGWFQSKGETK